MNAPNHHSKRQAQRDCENEQLTVEAIPRIGRIVCRSLARIERFDRSKVVEAYDY